MEGDQHQFYDGLAGDVVFRQVKRSFRQSRALEIL